MASASSEDKALIRALLAQQLVDREVLEKAWARWDSGRARERGDRAELSLRDYLIQKGLVSLEQLNSLDLEAGNSARRSTRSKPLEEERAPKNRRRGTVVGGFQLVDSQTVPPDAPTRTSSRRAAADPNSEDPSSRRRRDSLRSPTQERAQDRNSARNREATRARDSSRRRPTGPDDRLGELARAPNSARVPAAAQPADEDAETIAIDTAAAAKAAIDHIQARQRIEEDLARREAKKRKRVYFIALAALGLVGLAAFLVFLSGLGSETKTAENNPLTQQSPDIYKTPEELDGEVQKAFDRAIRLEQGELYLDSRLALEDLEKKPPRPLKPGEQSELAKRFERIGQLEAFKSKFEDLRIEVQDLVAKSEATTAARKLEAMCQSMQPLLQSATGQRLMTLLEELRLDLSKRPQETPGGSATTGSGSNDKPDLEPADTRAAVVETYKLGAEPESRAAKRAAQKIEAEARIASLRERLAAARSARDERFAREANRVAEATRERPLNVPLAGGLTLDSALVSAYNERGFTLKSGPSEISFRWESANPDLAITIRRLAARNDAESEMSLGRFCIEQRRFDDARRAYSRAIKIDSALAPRVPDVDALERDSRVFQGRCERLGGGLLELEYSFDNPAEIQDFERASFSEIRDGALEIRGTRVSPISLLNLEFSEQLSLTFEPKSASRKGLLAAGFIEAGAGAGRRGVLAAFQPANQALTLLAWDEAGTRNLVKPTLLRRAPKDITIALERGDITVSVDGRSAMTARFEPRGEGLVRAVLAAISKQDDNAVFESMSLRGEVGRRWLRKTFGAADARLRATMAANEDLPIFARPSQDPPPEGAVSAEDDYGLSALSPEDRKLYQDILRKLDSIRDFPAAAKALQSLILRRPGFAAGHYRMALALRRLSRRQSALAQAQRAAADCPGFAEALALRALLHADLGQDELARSIAEQALALRPDLAAARFALGRACFLARSLPEALAELDLAVLLDPWNDEARSLRRNIENVLAGPPWERRYVHETRHYRVETDISRAKAEFYGRHLEAMRAYYSEQFALDSRSDEKSPKAQVLIFDTREGFHSYARLTTDDRVESFLGYFHPRYQQLLLYEDRRDLNGMATLRVLYHEGFHQFADGLIPQIPFWLSEGLAEYYAGSRIDAERVVERAVLLPGRVRDLKGYLSSHGPMSFKDLMLQSPSEFYSGPVAVKYAQAWAMVHYFRNGNSQRLRGELDRYLALLREGAAQDEAFEKTFGALDLGAVERAFLEYVRQWP